MLYSNFIFHRMLACICYKCVPYYAFSLFISNNFASFDFSTNIPKFALTMFIVCRLALWGDILLGRILSLLFFMSFLDTNSPTGTGFVCQDLIPYLNILSQRLGILLILLMNCISLFYRCLLIMNQLKVCFLQLSLFIYLTVYQLFYTLCILSDLVYI